MTYTEAKKCPVCGTKIRQMAKEHTYVLGDNKFYCEIPSYCKTCDRYFGLRMIGTFDIVKLNEDPYIIPEGDVEYKYK